MNNESEKYICANHVNDYNLKLYISRRYDGKKQCSYCDNKGMTSVIRFEKLYKYIMESLTKFYNAVELTKSEISERAVKGKINLKNCDNKSGKTIIYPDENPDVFYSDDIILQITGELDIQKQLKEKMGDIKFERKMFEYNGNQYKNLWEMFVDYVNNDESFSVEKIVTEMKKNTRK